MTPLDGDGSARWGGSRSAVSAAEAVKAEAGQSEISCGGGKRSAVAKAGRQLDDPTLGPKHEATVCSSLRRVQNSSADSCSRDGVRAPDRARPDALRINQRLLMCQSERQPAAVRRPALCRVGN